MGTLESGKWCTSDGSMVNCVTMLFMGMVSMDIISGVSCWSGFELVDSKLLVSSNGMLLVMGVFVESANIGVMLAGIGLVWFPKRLVF